MKINAKQPSIKTYTLSYFKIGDVCMDEKINIITLWLNQKKKRNSLLI